MNSEIYTIRQLSPQDNWQTCAQLLQQLSSSESDTYDENRFQMYLAWLQNHSETVQVWVIVEKSTGCLVAHLGVFFETKWLHGLSVVAHLEDLVIHKNYRGKGLAKTLVNWVLDICRAQKCYKAILDCKTELSGFYEGLDFENSGLQMRIDF